MGAMRLLLSSLLLATFLAMVTGCASSSASADQEQVSTLPWNRPQKWEGTGMLGGLAN